MWDPLRGHLARGDVIALALPGFGAPIPEGFGATDRVAGLIGAGSPPDLAAAQAEKMDARMGECILALYRSAITVSAEWQPGVEAMPARPSLVLSGTAIPRAVGRRRPVRHPALRGAARGSPRRAVRPLRRMLALVAVGAGGRVGRSARTTLDVSLTASSGSWHPPNRGRVRPTQCHRDVRPSRGTLRRTRPSCSRSRARSSRAPSRCP